MVLGEGGGGGGGRRWIEGADVGKGCNERKEVVMRWGCDHLMNDRKLALRFVHRVINEIRQKYRLYDRMLGSLQ